MLNWSLSTWVRVECTRGALDPVKGTRHWSMTPRFCSMSCDHHTTKWLSIWFALICTWTSSQTSFKLTGNFLYGLMHRFIGQILTTLQQLQSLSVLLASVKSLSNSCEKSCLGVIDHCQVLLTRSNAPRVRSTCTRVDNDQFSDS